MAPPAFASPTGLPVEYPGGAGREEGSVESSMNFIIMSIVATIAYGVSRTLESYLYPLIRRLLSNTLCQVGVDDTGVTGDEPVEQPNIAACSSPPSHEHVSARPSSDVHVPTARASDTSPPISQREGTGTRDDPPLRYAVPGTQQSRHPSSDDRRGSFGVSQRGGTRTYPQYPWCLCQAPQPSGEAHGPATVTMPGHTTSSPNLGTQHGVYDRARPLSSATLHWHDQIEALDYRNTSFYARAGYAQAPTTGPLQVTPMGQIQPATRFLIFPQVAMKQHRGEWGPMQVCPSAQDSVYLVPE